MVLKLKRRSPFCQPIVVLPSLSFYKQTGYNGYPTIIWFPICDCKDSTKTISICRLQLLCLVATHPGISNFLYRQLSHFFWLRNHLRRFFVHCSYKSRVKQRDSPSHVEVCLKRNKQQV